MEKESRMKTLGYESQLPLGTRDAVHTPIVIARLHFDSFDQLRELTKDDTYMLKPRKLQFINHKIYHFQPQF